MPDGATDAIVSRVREAVLATHRQVAATGERA